MKFVMEVDLAAEADAERELGRILRYWAGNLRHYALIAGDGSVIYDSAYREVGRWTISGEEPSLEQLD